MKNQQIFSVYKWMFYTGVGWIAGVILVLIFAGILEGLHLDFQFIMPLSIGIGMGIMQWLYLRKFFIKSFIWVWLLIAGLTLPFAVFDLVSLIFKLNIEKCLWLLIIIGSILSGSLQYRLFLKNHFSNAAKWIIYSFLSWLIILLLMLVTSYTISHHVNRKIALVINLSAFVLADPFLGLISGKGLKSIMQNAE
jgi:hypothetical protein